MALCVKIDDLAILFPDILKKIRTFLQPFFTPVVFL